METTASVPTIALVGRPNVGKSTLFNRLAGGRRALVAATPGVTRDRREELVSRGNFRFRLVDTGGLGFERGAPFSEAIAEQVRVGVEHAEVVWLVVDGPEGLSPFDEEAYRWLLRSGKRVLVVVNKADNPRRAKQISEFYALGTDRIWPVSALHGNGVDEALEATAALVPRMAVPRELSENSLAPEAGIRISLVGRPNVGKSSLVNRILGDERMIVSDIPGTTREAVDLPFQHQGAGFVLIDTAGIRRKARTKEHLEKVGALNAIQSIRRAEVGVLVVDATEDVADQDARIARYILDERRAIVVALNKWDLAGADGGAAREIEENARYRLRFANFAAMVRTSAVTGMGVERLLLEVVAAHGQFTRRIQTADLNRVVGMSVLRQPPPARGRAPTKIFYGSQVRHSPPTFTFFTNHLNEIGDSYTRYMENQLRYHFGLKGSPLTILWRARRDSKKNPRKKRR